MGAIDAESHRRFYCARCHAVMVLCRRCDRGQRYCGPRCSEGARHESLRRAGRRHRRTVHWPPGDRGTPTALPCEESSRCNASGSCAEGGPGVASTRGVVVLATARRRRRLCRLLPRVRPENGSRTTAPSSASAPGQRCSRCGCQCGRFTRWDCLSELRPRRRTPHPRPTPAR